MMNMANIRPGGRYLAVDDASGMVVSAVLERMGGKNCSRTCFFFFAASHLGNAGEGRLLTICDVDSPPAYPVMTNMNFKKHIFASALSSLNWATVQEDYTPGRLNDQTQSIHL
jgi:tRNA (adenine-N(1)-)-methyltransferase non-catalytic subunit